MNSTTVSEGPQPHGGFVTIALVMRLLLFAFFQVVVALLLLATGTPDPWSASAAWWPFTAAATSVVTFLFLLWRSRAEPFSLSALYRPVRPGVGRDVLLALATAVVGGGLAVAGSIVLAPAFFADPLAANALLIQPLPRWAAVTAIVIFPVYWMFVTSLRPPNEIYDTGMWPTTPSAAPRPWRAFRPFA